MSTTTADTDAGALDLTRSEQWVLHHAMLQELEAAAAAEEPQPWWALAVLEQVEADGALALTCFEAWRVERSLRSYASDAPARDAEPARDIADRLDDAYGSTPLAAAA